MGFWPTVEEAEAIDKAFAEADKVQAKEETGKFADILNDYKYMWPTPKYGFYEAQAFSPWHYNPPVSKGTAAKVGTKLNNATLMKFDGKEAIIIDNGSGMCTVIPVVIKQTVQEPPDKLCPYTYYGDVAMGMVREWVNWLVDKVWSKVW